MAPLAPLLRPAGRMLDKPGQVKPTGLVKIDWTHPLTRGLQSYWIDIGAGRLIDLVLLRMTTLDASATSPTAAMTAFGSGINLNTINSSVHDPTVYPVQSWAHPYSCAVGFYQRGAASAVNGAYFGIADGSSNDAFMFFATSTTTFGLSIANNSSSNSFTFANNTYYTLVGATTGASSWNWWVNGAAQTAGALTTTFAGTNVGVEFGSVNYNAVTGANSNSVVFFGAVWNVQLSQADAIQLYADPYCFLVPAEPEMMIIQAAVADILYPQIWM